ncbi:hypothetical protein B0H67DRAFT_16870 [Lasiosphaeris hirsuta]|uniref:Secreted protein n=1 Tax=Lasiosphaeris hirsuta TaxID=260670 RepID=A0AA40B982_9PEZI|nr:hypothetical protein B0H67DRAFT_16870 [Lasiosphaeris hirsuta]
MVLLVTLITLPVAASFVSCCRERDAIMRLCKPSLDPCPSGPGLGAWESLDPAPEKDSASSHPIFDATLPSAIPAAKRPVTVESGEVTMFHPAQPIQAPVS